MKRFSASLLWLVMLGIAFSTYAVDDKVRFIEARCPFNIPDDLSEGRDVLCGFVTVPQDRGNLDSTPIQIAVAVFYAAGDAPAPDPLIFLDGGPGSETLFATAWFGYDLLVRPFIEGRDVILFDQRGVGFSQPSLNCPELEALFYDTLAQPPPDTNEAYFAVADQCRRRLLAAGVDLAAYTTTENAADVDAIREALGYEQINLWGISYGTYLAQYAMRQFPQHIRSVVLDAVLPVSADALEVVPTHHERAFNTLFAGCAADAQCDAAYPDLEATFYGVVDRLNATPIRVDGIYDPLRGQSHSVYVDGDVLIDLFFSQLYSTDTIPFLPQQIHALAADITTADTVLRRALVNFVVGPGLFSEGMGNTVTCNDLVPYNDLGDFERNVAALKAAQLAAYYTDPVAGSLAGLFEACARWHRADEVPETRLAVSSTIPTLIFSGEYDPITPPMWGEAVRQTLPNSYAYTLRGYGHGVTIADDCPVAMMRSFLANPQVAPPDACVAQLAGPGWRTDS